MNIKDFKMYINSLYLDNSKYYVIGSGVLLMYGIIDEINDVNLLVSHEIFENLKSVFILTPSSEFPYVYKISDRLNICEGIVRNDDFRTIEGIPVKKLNNQFIWYLNSLRNKDQEKVLKISNYYRRQNI